MGAPEMDFGHVLRAFQPPSHAGLDVAAPQGTPVPSLVDGVVEHVFHAAGVPSSEAVWIREPDGYRVVFAGLEKSAVQAGERVRAGEWLGLSGSRAEVPSESPHWHLGVQDANGHWVDPNRYFSAGNWLHQSSNHLKSAEEAFFEDRAEHLLTTVAGDLFRTFWEMALHLVAPISLVLFGASMLFVIVGSVKARKWAAYTGLLAAIGFREGWS